MLKSHTFTDVIFHCVYHSTQSERNPHSNEDASTSSSFCGICHILRGSKSGNESYTSQLNHINVKTQWFEI